MVDSIYFDHTLNVIIGLVTFPMTFITNTPIECTIHQDLWFSETFSLPNISAISSADGTIHPGTTKSASVVSKSYQKIFSQPHLKTIMELYYEG